MPEKFWEQLPSPEPSSSSGSKRVPDGNYALLYTYTEDGGFVPNPDVDIRAELEDQIENCPVTRRIWARLILKASHRKVSAQLGEHE